MGGRCLCIDRVLLLKEESPWIMLVIQWFGGGRRSLPIKVAATPAVAAFRTEPYSGATSLHNHMKGK